MEIELTTQTKLELKGLAYDQIGIIEAYEAQIRIHRENLVAINDQVKKRNEEEEKLKKAAEEVKKSEEQEPAQEAAE